MRRCYSKEAHEWPKVSVRSYPIESNLIEFRDISPLEEMVVDSRGVEMVSYSVDEDELASESSVLDLFEEGVVESRYIGSRLVLKGILSAISVSRFVTKHNVELDEVEIISGCEVV